MSKCPKCNKSISKSYVIKEKDDYTEDDWEKDTFDDYDDSALARTRFIKKFYHGTSTAFTDSILRNGIQSPKDGKLKQVWPKCSRKDGIYLVEFPEDATQFAEIAEEKFGGDQVIWEIDRKDIIGCKIEVDPELYHQLQEDENRGGMFILTGCKGIHPSKKMVWVKYGKNGYTLATKNILD